MVNMSNILKNEIGAAWACKHVAKELKEIFVVLHEKGYHDKMFVDIIKGTANVIDREADMMLSEFAERLSFMDLKSVYDEDFI